MLLLGASGAGKTYWWQGRYQSHEVLNLDQLRLMLAGDIACQQVTPGAVEIRRIVLEHRVQAGLPTVLDATNARSEHRMSLLGTARRWHRPTIAVVFHTSLRDCLDRQMHPDRVEPRAGQPAGRSTPPRAVEAQYAEIARVWSRMGREVDCVVHVSPDGWEEFAVGDVPRPVGVDAPGWLQEMPRVPSAGHLPWRPPFLEATS